MKRLAALLFALLCLPAQAANTWGTDLSDLWYNRNESGWGINIAHQQEVLFATLFVYGSNGRTQWYVAPDLRSNGSSYTFTGTLYETTGPYFGAAFNPAQVNARAAGTMTFALDSVVTAFLTYTVDGVSVTKGVQRQTFRNQDMSGRYVGVVAGARTGCGTATEVAGVGDVTITHANNLLTMTAPANNNASCTYTGTYQQFGRMGQIDANVTCGGVPSGTAIIFEIEAGPDGFFSRYVATFGTCREEGRILGIR